LSLRTIHRQSAAIEEFEANRVVYSPDGNRFAFWDGELINEINMGTAIYMTPVVANNVLYIPTRNSLYAIEETTVPK